MYIVKSVLMFISVCICLYMYVYVSIVYMLCSPMFEEIKNISIYHYFNRNCVIQCVYQSVTSTIKCTLFTLMSVVYCIASHVFTLAP